MQKLTATLAIVLAALVVCAAAACGCAHPACSDGCEGEALPCTRRASFVRILLARLAGLTGSPLDAVVGMAVPRTTFLMAPALAIPPGAAPLLI